MSTSNAAGHRRVGSARVTARRLLRIGGFVPLVVSGIVAASCSSSTAANPSPSSQPRPAGPAATFSPLTGGQGISIESAAIAQSEAAYLKTVGYTQREFAASGIATSYQASGPLTADGRWSFLPATRAPYRTRVLVRTPADPSRFSGRVVVEWLNVSGGVDADPDWTTLREEIVRSGDAWVGVSAQRIGVMGGPVLVTVQGVAGANLAGVGLRSIDAARYGSLVHPGDGYAFDIYTQVARALRSGAGLGGVHPDKILAAGESQSAFALVTYYNGVQPLTHAFDGFFVHSRGAVGLPLVPPGKGADIAGAISGTPTIFRTDQSAPVLDIQSETDVGSILNSYAARQPDTARFRLWEVTGTSHADVHLVGASTAAVVNCGVPINNGAMHVVAKAALGALETWVDTGATPVVAPRLDVAPGATPEIRRDADGIAIGGIRTPPVDVPVATLSGVPGPNPSTICLLLGSTIPFTPARIAEFYPSRTVYVQRYTAATDATIRAGFALRADRAALLGYADPSAVTG